MSEIHLLCNAHIDPVWQWEWEEGAAAAVSTFRAAADFCEEFDDFVFCHNEALLYRWVEEYEPKLFERIHRLVKAGKWVIMGGWYLQSDCNMPGGESIIRQMQLGREYFREKFGVECKTAVSFDAFGHDRGLVQLLKKAGYNSYLFMRPDPGKLTLPGNDFMWVGYDGSEIMAHRIDTGYNSPLGGARDKVENWLKDHPDAKLGLIPWGVGNHGGGPSRKDIADINAFKAECPKAGLKHSTAEDYFAALAPSIPELPRFDKPLRPWGVGCYTSQVRIKQQHRELEGLLNYTERMLAHASMAGLVKYPAEEIAEAERALCMSEFHDILPGSSIQPVEDNSLQGIYHGKELLMRLRARAFYALSADEKRAAPGEYPILVYNPFPYEVEQEVECEFMLADQNWKEEFTDMAVYSDGERLPSQIEKERSNLPLDWRKRVVFRAKLAPMQINRFSCFANVLPAKPEPECTGDEEKYVFKNDSIHVEISRATGLISRYCVNGTDYLAGEAMKLLVVNDSVDPWGMTVDRFRDVIGEFKLMTNEDSARFAGVVSDSLAPVRVIESGPVRTVIEAAFRYNDSCALITYRLPASGTAVAVDVRLLMAEKDKMIKLSVPTVIREKCLGQGMFGAQELNTDGTENVSQQWLAAAGMDKMLTVANNGVYGSDFCDGEMRISLMRTAAFTAHPIFDRVILPQDRFSPRIDQGERLYRFVMNAGDEKARMADISREAQLLNEPPYALSFFPDGDGKAPVSAAKLTGKGVQLTALRPARDGSGIIVRLFEATGNGGSAHMELPMINAAFDAELAPFEILTMKVDPATGKAAPASILD